MLSPAFAQVMVFSESFGVVNSTRSLEEHLSADGFDAKVLDFGSGFSGNPADIRGSSASSAYVQYDASAASAGANVFFSSTGTHDFSIGSIETRPFDSLQLYFAYRKESGSTNAGFRVLWSIDQWNTYDSL
ncbi:MAG: hypothetical protein LPK45_08470, partial [Bacteroidota bacterium]|nr:hypothetical protein [Bacteroidota bacterium]MDX5431106.1 hypothetical protein [Bacteroidota bacterium]MDX5469856.1 hypothetical protein [Bacteroidota bacterium]